MKSKIKLKKVISILVVVLILGSICACKTENKSVKEETTKKISSKISDDNKETSDEKTDEIKDEKKDEKKGDDVDVNDVNIDDVDDTDNLDDLGDGSSLEINQIDEELLRSAQVYEAYGDYEEAPIKNAFASSQLDIDEDYYKYHPENLYDRDFTTAYVEGVPGNGIGQMVKFEFGTGNETMTYAITKIQVCPGYQKSDETFENNSRPTKLGFYFPNGRVETMDLSADYGKDSVYTLDIDPVITDSCVMMIEDAVSGKKYKDCCITEMYFYAQSTDGMMYYETDPGPDPDQEGVSANYIVSGCIRNIPVWSYQTHNPLTELTSNAYLTSGFGKVIVYDEQKIVALDALTGDVLWVNEDTGFPSACSFDNEGNLYICSYYGSNVCAIDPDGNTIWSEYPAGEKYTWACMMALNNEDREISIYYAKYDDDDDTYGKVFTTEY